MGRSYFVPRSVKGEGRILYIFTMKSFIVTLMFGLVGAGVWYLLSSVGVTIGTVTGLIIVGVTRRNRLCACYINNSRRANYGTT